MISNKRWLELRDVDVSGLVSKKQGMDYIGWGDYELLLRLHLTDEEFQPLVFEVCAGYVNVYIEGVAYPLAISDFRNNAIPNPDATDINDTIQRAFVKAYARHYGLGHKLYEGSNYSDATPKSVATKVTSKPSNTKFF